MSKPIRAFVFCVFPVLMSGCAKEPPKCSDEATFNLVRQIVIEQLGNREGVTDKELQENIRIELPRASAFDEKIKKYTCEAKLVAGAAMELPVTYESQLDDKNEHIVTVGGISRAGLIGLKFAIAEGIKKGRATSPSAEARPEEQPTQPNHLPSITEGTPYSDVRDTLLKAGWEPVKLPEADVCSDFDSRCKGRPEMEACAGSGMANCKFSWRKNGVLKRVCTVGEDASFSSYCD